LQNEERNLIKKKCKKCYNAIRRDNSTNFKEKEMKDKKVTLRMLILFLLLLSVNAFSYLSSAQAQIPGCPTGISHYWTLDEDNSPYGDSYGTTSATCTNCPTATSGVVNGAQQFNGTEKVNVADDNTFDWSGSDSFSIEFWMKTTDDCNSGSSTSPNPRVVIGRDDGSLQWWAGCIPGGQASFFLSDTNGNMAGVTSNKLINNGEWHHVVAVRDAVAQEISIYVDGNLESSVSGLTFPGGFNSTVELNIGWLNRAGTTGYHFKGTVDEIALYNRALLDVEIRSHYYIARGYCDLCNTPIKIMPLGDSITRGTDPEETGNNYIGYRRELYLDLKNAGYNVDFVGTLHDPLNPTDFDRDHEGWGGYTADVVAADIYGWLNTLAVQPDLDTGIAGRPDIVLLHIGTNDISDPNKTTEQITQEVSDILDNIDSYSKDITVILSRVINRTDGLDQKITQLNNELATMANNRIANGDKIIIVDHENALIYPDDMSSSPVLPNMTGYDKMADVWFNALVDILPICELVPPSIVSTPIIEAGVGVPYSYDVDAIGSPMPTYGLETAPNGMSINQITGIIGWTPAEVGTVDVNVVAANTVNTENTDAQPFTIDVVEYPIDMSHYWKLDEPKEPLYHDYYGSSDALCTYNCPVATAGIVKGAQQFSGSEKVYVPNGRTCNWGSNDSFSIEFWMKENVNTNTSQVAIARTDPSTNLLWWVGSWYTNNVAAFRLTDKTGAGPTNPVLGITDIADGKWHHIVAVRDGSLGESRIYVDGQLEGSQSYTYTSGFDAPTPLTIGWLDWTDFHFDGTIDEIAIYNRALSDDEILYHFNSGSAGIGYRALKNTITATAGSGGSISPSGAVEVSYGEDQTFSITPDTGYHIVDVKVDGNSAGAITSYTFPSVTSNHTIAATFAINQYSVSASAGSNGSLDSSTPSPATVNYGATTSFKFDANSNYHVASVSSNCGTTYTNTSNSVTTYTYTTGPITTSGCTVSATFAANTHTVTPSAGANGSISPSTPQTVNDGSTVSFTVTPNIGYNTASVAGCGGTWTGTNPYTTGPVSDDCTVTATFTPYTAVKLLEPNCEVIPSGSSYTIQWEAPPEAVTFKLLLSMNNGLTWSLIAKDIPPSSSYDWTVPTPKNNKKKCLVKVIGFDSNGKKVGADKSDTPFTIEVVKVTSPNGGETFVPGDSPDITWTANATGSDVASVRLFYTKNGGLTWIKIDELEGNPGIYYGWTVPNVAKAKAKCKVKVVLKDASGNTVGKDVSDNYFTIQL
jgi:lysophospholipase L1-like esterase